ncbi:hypothetical protein [Microvirga roseola]|uniref:hypothetical protein n=1 Tax=Microvirga roseola TaxID=2883126 RepID=UPI001E4C67CE|nr:hypothetical protein [Microvirga roseola]
MTINRGFNLSASVIETETDIMTGEATSLADTYDIFANVSTGSIEGSTDELALALNADATAVGDDTVAALSAEGSLTTSATTNSAQGSITASAASTSPDQAYASATSSTDLIGGAEYSVSLNYGSTLVNQDEAGTSATSTSTSSMFALTVEEPTFSTVAVEDLQIPIAESSGGPEEDMLVLEASTASVDGSCDFSEDCEDDWDGNIAIFETDLTVYAQDSYVALDLYAFTVEDQISSINMSALLAAG